jgi:L-seryl-tRNA(Ser) seleniumtransferase
MNWKLGRRSFLSSLAAAGAAWLSSGKLNAAELVSGASDISKTAKGGTKVDGDRIIAIKSGLGSTGNIYAELGLTPIINIGGTITVIGNALMKPEVMELARMGNEHFVFLNELEVAAGKFIANLCKSPASHTGLVTGGSAASIVVGYAAMMTEDFESRLEALPDVTGFPRTEVIIQKQDRYPFDHQIRQTGAKLVEVETRDEMIAAINPRTVAIHFCPQAHRGQVSAEETVAIAKAHNLYSFCDGGGSSDLPPKAHLWEYQAVGFDMVCFGGGKDISGPAGTGVLIGRKDLISWALLNMSPQENRIGRSSKVGKEQIFALLKALELFVNQDEDVTLRIFDARAQVITDALAKLGVKALPRSGTFGVTLRYSWEWDPAKFKLTGTQVMEALAATKPVAIGYILPPNYAGSQGMRGRLDPNKPAVAGRDRGDAADVRGHSNPHSFGFSTWVLKDGEDKIIADRLVEIFSAALVPSSMPAAKKS